MAGARLWLAVQALPAAVWVSTLRLQQALRALQTVLFRAPDSRLSRVSRLPISSREPSLQEPLLRPLHLSSWLFALFFVGPEVSLGEVQTQIELIVVSADVVQILIL